MGTEWILRLADFFNPSILEKLGLRRFSGNDDDQESFCWFDETSRLSCAVFSQMILYNALNRGVGAAKHQTLLYESAPMVLSSAAFWIARNGPKELVSVALSFLGAMVSHNANVGIALSNLQIKLSPPIEGTNIPRGQEVTSLQFSWKPLPNDDRRHIAFLSLLAERYIFPTTPWHGSHGDYFKNGLDVEYEIRDDFGPGNKNRLDLHCLSLFEKVMSVDSTLCDMTVQYILAPPPPPMLSDSMDGFDDYADHQIQLETMKPLGGLLSHLLVGMCDKLLGHGVHSHHSFGVVGTKNEMESGERVTHLLSIIFMHGSLLARELSTAITTSHVRNLKDPRARHSHEGEVKPFLPLILATVGKSARLPGGTGYPFVASILQLLAIVVTGCERATRQLFEDPSNLFVVDLATTSSEIAGVPPSVQVLACLFLGCCSTGFPAAVDKSADLVVGMSAENSIFSRRAFLSMIDARIGLNRFNEILKKPLTLLGSKKIAGANPYDGLFDLPGFKEFYEHQVDSIKEIIFELYSGGANNGSNIGGDSVQLEVIASQKAKIQELEEKLSQISKRAESQKSSEVEGLKIQNVDLQKRIVSLEEEVALKEEQLVAKENTEINLFASIKQLEKELAALRLTDQRERDQRLTLTNELRIKDASLKELESLYNENAAKLSSSQVECESLQRQCNAYQQQIEFLQHSSKAQQDSSSNYTQKIEGLEDLLHKANQELLRVKESCLQESALRKSLQESTDVKDRRLSILEEELTALRNSRDSVEMNKNQYRDENKHLQELLADKELFLSDLQLQLVDYQEKLSREEMKHFSSSSGPIASTLSMSSIMDLIYTLEIEESEEVIPFVEKFVAGDGFDGSVQMDELVSGVVQCCRSTIHDAAAVCTDLAEGVAIYNLDGKEGSLLRIIDCCQKLRTKCLELQDSATDSNQYSVLVEELKAQLEFQEAGKREALLQMEELESNLLQLKAMNDQLTDALGTKIHEMETFTNDRMKWERDAEMHNREILHLKESIEAILVQLYAANDDRDKLAQQLSSSKQTHEDQMNQLKGLIENIRSDHHELELSKQEELSFLKTQLADFQQLAVTAEKSSFALASVENELNTKILSLETEISDLNKLVDELKQRITALQVDNDILMEAARAKDEELACYQAELQCKVNPDPDHQERNQVLENIKIALDHALEDKSRLGDINSQLQSEVETNNEVINSLIQEKDRLVVEKLDLEKKIGSFEENLSAYRVEISELRDKECKNLDEISSLRLQCNVVQRLLEDTKTDFEERLQQHIAEADSKIKILDENDQKKDQERLLMIMHLESEKEEMLTELQVVRNQLIAASATEIHAKNLEQEIQELQLRIDALHQEYELRKSDLEQEINQKLTAEWEQKVELIKSQYLETENSLALQLEAINKEIAIEQKKGRQLTQRILDLEEELKMTNDEKMKAVKEKDNEVILAKTLCEQELEQIAAKHKEEIAKLKSTVHHEEENKTKHLIAKVMTLQEEKRKLEEKIAFMTQEKENDHVANNQDVVLIQNLQSTIKSMTTEKERMKLLITSKNDEIKHLNQVMVKLQDEYSALKETWDVIAGDKSHPFVLQEQELKRLSDSLTKVHHELHQKEDDLKNLTSKLAAKEGEIAGLRESLQLEKQSYGTLSKQFDELYETSLEQQRKLREMPTSSVGHLSSSGMQSNVEDDHRFLSGSSTSTNGTPIKSTKTTSTAVNDVVSATSPVVTETVRSPPGSATIAIINPSLLATPSPNGGSDRKRVEPPMSVMKTASPAVKDAARLNAEIIKEVGIFICGISFLYILILFVLSEEEILRIARAAY